MVVVEGELILVRAAADVVAEESMKEAAVGEASGEMTAKAAVDELNTEVVAEVTVLSSLSEVASNSASIAFRSFCFSLSVRDRSGRSVEGVEGMEGRGGSVFDRVVLAEGEVILLVRYSRSFSDARGSEEERELLVGAGGRWRGIA